MALLTRSKETSTLDPLRSEHRERQKLYGKYWDYYKGNHHKPLKVATGQPDDNLILNYSRKIVNQSNTFLFGKEVIFEVDGKKERSDTEAYLDFVWQADPMRRFNKMRFLQGLGLNGAVTGTPFVRLYPKGDYPGQPDRETFVLLNPSLVDVIVEDDDMMRVREYHIVWKAADVWKRDRIARDITVDASGNVRDTGLWYISREVKEKGDRDWRETERVSWPYSWPPIFDCQNLENTMSFWGDSDLADADLNDAINFTGSNTNRILKFHAHPKTVGTGFDSSQLQLTAVDSFWTVPDKEATIRNLEMQSDLASSHNHLATLKNDYHEITNTANISPSEVQVGAISGFALTILYGPQLSKMEKKRESYGGLLSRLNMAILELAGKGEGIVVNNQWQNPLPRNGVDMSTEAKTLIDAGADRATAFELAGYTREEAEKLAASRTLIPEEAGDNIGEG